MLKRILAVGILGLAITALALLWYTDRPEQSSLGTHSLRPETFLAASNGGGFAKITSSREFEFPADHGPHPEHRTEWWSVSGILDPGAPRPAAFQLMMTRLGLTARLGQRASEWAASAAYLGGLAVSRRHRSGPAAGQRASRAALSLAGAESNPTRIWIEDWQLQRDASGAWRLRAATGELELELELTPKKPSLSMSGLAESRSDGGPPFHFYILPRMAAEGAVSVNGNRSRATGVVSLEHAWGELPLPGGPVARDRFSLYLDDGRELFLVRTHSTAGSGASGVDGILVDQEGSQVALTTDEIELEPTAHWVSERSGARYPVRWALRIPSRGIELAMAPYSDNGEVVVWTPMWVGALSLRGHAPAGSLAGRGFVQLNGYAGTEARR